MVPTRSVSENYAERTRGTQAYKIDFDNKKIGEIIDGKEALIQGIRLALMTQRYKYITFSHSFGTDYKNALDQGYVKAMGIIKNSIYDSLICDDRINNVNNFSFEKVKRGMKVNFTVHTIYGDVEYETEVNNV